ncbi:MULTISPECIES: hypothetical protein [Sphingobacterium]|uniref:hypothetical protein n=1 Tax=Sphingobacterium TaxID=28453 RepID=UPI00257B0ED6|nr:MULTISPECIES: hypothetical protein [Sphingobacterium]
MINLLQAAYKIIEIPEHSCYEIFKDIFVPIIGSGLGVFGAYWVMSSQIKQTKQIESEKENKKLLTTKEILKLNIPDMIDKMHFVYKTLMEQKGNFNSFEIEHVVANVFNLANFHIIANLGYQKILDLVISENIDRDIFNNFWISIDRFLMVVKDFETTYTYIDSKVTESKKIVNSILDTLNPQISILINKVGGVPYLDINKDPKLILGAELYKIKSNLYINDGKTNGIKIYTFFKEIRELSKDTRFYKIIPPKIISDAISGLLEFDHREAFMKGCVISYENMTARIPDDIEHIKRFEQLLK